VVESAGDLLRDMAYKTVDLEFFRKQLPESIDLRFVIIDRGRRRFPRRKAPGVVCLDGNAMHWDAAISAVKMAAGDVSQNDDTQEGPENKSGQKIFSRSEARAAGRMILVTEDNEINQKVMTQQLRILGYASDIASTGKEAEARWKQEKYNLILADLHMPDMDGYSLVQKIREGEKPGKRVPVIAFTAGSPGDEDKWLEKAGFDDWLRKPARLFEIRQMLEKWLPSKDGKEDGSPKETQSVVLGDKNAQLPVDIEILHKMVGEGQEIVHGLLESFLKNAASIAADIRRAHLENKALQIGELAHRLKSAARYVGATELGDLCEQMEHAGKNNEMKIIDEFFAGFEEELQRVEIFIKNKIRHGSNFSEE
jgi:CheY-like chemotaxis protein/HPt (histidine-containing phosphotransfer) domain-containing protein